MLSCTSLKGLRPFLLLFLLITSSFTFAQSGIFAGGPIYYGDDYSIDELRESGFTTVIVWTIHINHAGDLNYNGEFIICKDGKYVGDEKWPDFAANISKLKTAPTSVNRVEAGLSAWASTTFDNIKDLVAAQGTGPESILYKNFKALREAIPGFDAINFDDESTYDVASSTEFAVMLADLGFKVTLCPYTAQNYWKNVAANTNTQRPGAVDLIYLQCYAGGAGNEPATWINHFPGIPLYPGLWDTNDTPAEIQNKMNNWQNSAGIEGGFLWLYDDIDNTPKVQQYAAAFNTALDITFNLNAGAASPSPDIGQIEVPSPVTLSWTAGENAVSHNVYFGTTPDPDFIGNQTETEYTPANTEDNTKYYWRVDEVTADDTVKGPVWFFTTVYPVPVNATTPTPEDGAADVNMLTSLSWVKAEYATSYDLFLGTTQNLGAQDLIGNLTTTLYQPADSLEGNTEYFWRVDTKNATGTTTGDVWRFTTMAVGSDTIGSSLIFDGSDDYVSAGNPASLQITGNQITLEAWVFPIDFKPEIWAGAVIGKDYASGGDKGYSMRCGGNGRFDVSIGSGSWNEIQSPENIVTLAEWNHLAATYNGTDLSLYLNCDLVATRSASFNIANGSSPLLIGESSAFSGRVFNGKIDEVRVWNIARTAAEIKESYDKKLDESYYSENSGLVGYWRFEEGGGQFTKDLSFFKNNATLGASDAADAKDPVWSVSGAQVIVGVEELISKIAPSEFDLSQNYPNPFNPSTSIEYSVPESTNVNIAVYDTLGNRVAVLVDGYKNSGKYKVNFDASQLASGVYIYRLRSGKVLLSHKMILLK